MVAELLPVPKYHGNDLIKLCYSSSTCANCTLVLRHKMLSELSPLKLVEM
jgi:hypothetical protein